MATAPFSLNSFDIVTLSTRQGERCVRLEKTAVARRAGRAASWQAQPGEAPMRRGAGLAVGIGVGCGPGCRVLPRPALRRAPPERAVAPNAAVSAAAAAARAADRWSPPQRAQQPTRLRRRREQRLRIIDQRQRQAPDTRRRTAPHPPGSFDRGGVDSAGRGAASLRGASVPAANCACDGERRACKYFPAARPAPASGGSGRRASTQRSEQAEAAHRRLGWRGLGTASPVSTRVNMFVRAVPAWWTSRRLVSYRCLAADSRRRCLIPLQSGRFEGLMAGRGLPIRGDLDARTCAGLQRAGSRAHSPWRSPKRKPRGGSSGAASLRELWCGEGLAGLHDRPRSCGKLTGTAHNLRAWVLQGPAEAAG